MVKCWLRASKNLLSSVNWRANCSKWAIAEKSNKKPQPYSLQTPHDGELWEAGTCQKNQIWLTAMSLSLSWRQCSKFRQELGFEKNRRGTQHKKATREKVQKSEKFCGFCPMDILYICYITVKWMNTAQINHPQIMPASCSVLIPESVTILLVWPWPFTSLNTSIFIDGSIISCPWICFDEIGGLVIDIQWHLQSHNEMFLFY